MAKFFRLVKNEYIKTIKKVSTKIMLILIILAAAGVSVLTFAIKTLNTDDFNYSDQIVDFSVEIEDLKKMQPEGYENQIKIYEYLTDKKIKPGDWQAIFALNLPESIPQEQLYTDILDNVIEPNGDWKKACAILKNNVPTDSGAKWEYEYRLEHNIPFGDTWKDNAITEISDNKEVLKSLADENKTSESKKLEEKIKLNQYRLDHNIEIDVNSTMSSAMETPSDELNFWSAMSMSTALISLIGLLVIIIAGSCVANEFSQGTIKFLLINPVKRWKILMSKYFTVVTFGYIMIALLFVVMIPFAGIFLGFDGISTPYLYISGGTIHEMSPFLQVAKLYLLNSIDVVVMATMAFALSSLFKSSALAIGAGVFCMMGGSTLIQVLAMLNQDWARYLIFANTNLADIYNGASLFPQHSLIFAIVVIAVHMIIFLLTAWDGFTKREVWHNDKEVLRFFKCYYLYFFVFIMWPYGKQSWN